MGNVTYVDDQARSVFQTWAAGSKKRWEVRWWEGLSEDQMKIFHLLYGLHSNIPVCCVRAWLRDELPPMGYDRCGYRRCKDCMDGRIVVEVHHCSGKQCIGSVAWFRRAASQYSGLTLFLADPRRKKIARLIGNV